MIVDLFFKVVIEDVIVVVIKVDYGVIVGLGGIKV